MNNDSFAARSLTRRITVAVVATTLVLGWATTAHAQQTPAEGQYGGSTESGVSAINQALDPAGGTDTDSAAGGSSLTGITGATGPAAGGSSLTGITGATEGSGVLEAGATGRSGLTGLLPSTGGPLLPLALLGGLALSSAGLLLVRRNSRQ